MTKKSRTQTLWSIAGFLSIIAALLWLIKGNIPMAMTNIAVGMLFIIVGVLNARKVDKKENPASGETNGNG